MSCTARIGRSCHWSHVTCHFFFIFERLFRLNQSDSSHLLSLSLVTCHSLLFLANERIQFLGIQTSLAIVFPSQLESRESILISSKIAVHRFIQIDETTFNDKQSDHRLG